MMEAVAYAHIELREKGVPYIVDTQTKVVEIVLDHTAYGWDAEEIHRQHPHLSLGEIHSALAYYYDHRAEIDQDIDRRQQNAEQIRRSLSESKVAQKIQRVG